MLDQRVCPEIPIIVGFFLTESCTIWQTLKKQKRRENAKQAPELLATAYKKAEQMLDANQQLINNTVYP